ncbi:MAG: hypothetical protein CH6_3349 [Candidatus Kapaibacterium sp.]|nr:MAG: hypothetical protein CH6_3349 [Candidatus Kapabacteria bacterium]
MKTFLILFLFFFLFFISCNTTEDPNTLSGDPKTEFSNVGDTTTAWFDLRDIGLGNKEIVVDVAVVSNNNGIVTSRGKLVVDTAITHKIDTTLGTATLPEEIKKAIREKFIRAFNAKIDSSDKNNIKIEFEIKSKVTTEGIQDFHHSEGDLSKPFTLVKYSAKVGDKYEFKDNQGNKFVREVTQRSTTDDYPIGFWLIKVIVVEETIEEGPYKDLFGKITYYTNHKFGLVGVKYEINGKNYKINIWPPNL